MPNDATARLAVLIDVDNARTATVEDVPTVAATRGAPGATRNCARLHSSKQ